MFFLSQGSSGSLTHVVFELLEPLLGSLLLSRSNLLLVLRLILGESSLGSNGLLSSLSGIFLGLLGGLVGKLGSRVKSVKSLLVGKGILLLSCFMEGSSFLGGLKD
jgi:hypothetical protein